MCVRLLLHLLNGHLRVVCRGQSHLGHFGVRCLLELGAAHVAGGLLVVDLLVPLSLVRAGEPPAARLAGKRLLAGVGTNVGSEVIGTRETAEADVALEGFLASVDPEMSCELVRSRESLATVVNRANMWFLGVGFGYLRLFGRVEMIGGAPGGRLPRLGLQREAEEPGVVPREARMLRRLRHGERLED